MNIKPNNLIRAAFLGGAFCIATSANLLGIVPVTDGLILHLQAGNAVLDNGTVTGITDLSGLGNHAAGAGGAPAFVSGATPSGHAALSFDGSSQYMEVGASADFDGRAKTTFIIFRADVLGVGRMINSAYSTLDPVNSPNSAHYAVGSAFANSGGGGAFRIQNRNSTGNAVSLSTPNSTVAAGAFYLGVNLWEADGNISAIVVNEEGVRASNSVAGATANPQGHLWTRIGAGSGTGNANAQDYFNGDIAAILMFNRALDSEELAAMENYLYETYLIPEPATVALILGGVVLGGALWRRKLSVERS